MLDMWPEKKHLDINMKFLVLFSLFLITVVNAVNQDLMRKIKLEVIKIGSQCAQQQKVGESDMTRFMSRKLPKTHEGFCTVSCVQKHFGLQNADGTFPREGFDNFLKPLTQDDAELYDAAMDIYDNICSKLPTGEDHCENAMQMVKCLIKEAEQRGVTAEVLGL